MIDFAEGAVAPDKEQCARFNHHGGRNNMPMMFWHWDKTLPYDVPWWHIRGVAGVLFGFSPVIASVALLIVGH